MTAFEYWQAAAGRGARRTGFAAMMVAVLLCDLAPASAEPVIRSIEVVGNQRLAAETVRHAAGLRIGESCAPARLNAAIKAAFASGQLADVAIECRDGVARITVAESPVIGTVTFVGRSAIDEKELKAATGMAAAEPYTRAKGEAAAERVRALYRAKGHADVGVELSTRTDQRNRIAVVLTIREAAIVKIERISFTGNRAFSERQLSDVVTMRQAGLFDFLKPVTAPVDDRLQHDRVLLKRHYLKHGYADVSVGEAEATRAPPGQDGKPGGWRIVFPIDEGSRYSIGSVTVSGRLAGPSADTLITKAALKAGDVYNPEAVEKAAEQITAALVDAGQPTAQVSPRISRDPGTRVIGIDLEVRGGPRILIERIEIRGNRITRDHVVRRELAFTEGDLYHPLRIETARKRLMRLGLFKSVEIRRADAGKSAPDKVVLTITVVEANSGELGFGVGYSQNEGIIGDVSWSERNLLGRGQDLKVKLAGSQQSLQAQLSFTEPRFLDTRLAAGFDLFAKDTDLTTTSSHKTWRYGGTLRVGTEIAPNTTATLNYTLARTTIYDVRADASQAVKLAVPGFPGTTSAAFTTSSVGYALAYDTRDSRTTPMSGVMIRGGQDLAGVGGDVRYLRSSAEARGYLPVTKDITIAARASGGTITGWGGSEVSLLDNFYRGGETVRGFASSGFGPRDVLSPRQDALGGTSYIATTAELRFPLPGVPEEIGLRGAIFADAGSLFGTSKAAKALPGVVGTNATLRASVGAGLIWDSPVGPLHAGYVLPVAKQPFDKTQNLYFGLGSGL